MDDEKIRELQSLLHAFMGLLHEKFLFKFRSYNNIEPRVNKNQMKIMRILYQQDKVTSTQIGKMLDIEKGSLTTLIDQLVALGFVDRVVDPNDRRRILLSLNKAGQERIETVMEQYTLNLRELFRDVDSEEMELFINSIKYAVNFMRKL